MTAFHRGNVLFSLMPNSRGSVLGRTLMGAAEFLLGELQSPCRAFSSAHGNSAGCAEPGILKPRPIHQHLSPCVITLDFTTLTALLHVFIITIIILELQSRSILCKSGMPGQQMNCGISSFQKT